jgi:hypothetical protein
MVTTGSRSRTICAGRQPLKLSATPVRKDLAPPLLNTPHDDVLRGVLGYTDASGEWHHQRTR